MADSTYGFHFRYRKCGAPPTILDLLSKDTATHTKGDLVSLEAAGEVQIAATNETIYLGAVQETISATDSTTYVKVIVDDDAVYGVYDANARYLGEKLDISGTTGAMTVATDSNHDLTVIANSTATEETLVTWTFGYHYMQNPHT